MKSRLKDARMRSYYSHLNIAKTSEEQLTHRASAIFPAFQDKDTSTRLIFLGYWLLKRAIQDVQARVYVRDSSGTLAAEHSFHISQAKAYRVELNDWVSTRPFMGSIEIEFISPANLVFPYPAVTVNYYGAAFSSTVHTAQRTFNDPTDALRNSETNVPESGFTLYGQEGIESFATFINGAKPIRTQTLLIKLYNLFGDQETFSLRLPELAPYQLFILSLSEVFPISSFLRGKPGTCKLEFSLSEIFPRLLLANGYKNLPPWLSRTHITTALTPLPQPIIGRCRMPLGMRLV